MPTPTAPILEEAQKYLRKLVEDAGYAEAERRLQVDQRTIRRWLEGETVMSEAKADRILNTFNVVLNYKPCVVLWDIHPDDHTMALKLGLVELEAGLYTRMLERSSKWHIANGYMLMTTNARPEAIADHLKNNQMKTTSANVAEAVYQYAIKFAQTRKERSEP